MAEFQKVAAYIFNSIIHIWPYLVLTIPIAVAVNTMGLSKHISKAFNKRPIIAVLLATVVGALSPFCSCGVIPLIASLLIGGVPLAPVMSFWLASPSMDPEIFLLSVSVLGWELAVWRLVSTFIMSLGAGYLTHLLITKGLLGNDILKTGSVNPVKSFKHFRTQLKNFVGNFTSPSEKLALSGIKNANTIRVLTTNESCGCSCNSNKENENANEQKTEPAKKNTQASMKRKLINETGKAVIMVTKFMALAYLLQAVIMLYVPEEWIIGLLGSENPYSILTAALAGIPVYTSGISAIALTGGLLQQGMTPAAVLAFLISGPTTTIPAMAAVYNLVRFRIFALYIGCTLASAILLGYLFDFLQQF